MNCAIKLDGVTNSRIENCKISGFTRPIEATNCENNIIIKNEVTLPKDYPRRKPCYCNSGKLYKNCCGRKKMIGIKVKGDKNKIVDNKVMSSGCNSVGIDIEGNENDVLKNQIISDEQIKKMIKQMSFPENTPTEYINEVLIVKPKESTKYKLYEWLEKNGINASWGISTLISLAPAMLQSFSGH
ncbi:MAG: SEC-C metal-binding domain-containing protein [Fusobacteriaceae bacterium]